MNVEQAKSQFYKFYWISKANSNEQAAICFSEVLSYLCYQQTQDGVFSKQEADFIEEMLGMSQDQMISTFNYMDFDHFRSHYPESLLYFIELDEQENCPYEDSVSRNYIDFLENLGKTFIAVDGSKDVEIQAVKDYVDWITTYAKQALAPKMIDPGSIWENTEFDLDGQPKNPPFPFMFADTESDLDDPSKNAPKPQPVDFKPATKDSEAVSIPTTGSTSRLDFWQAFKPYIDKLRHTEFSKVKIKDRNNLDAKPTVIVGVHNSILMRVSKKNLRLELYINTETEAGNLQILDHIKANIQVPPTLKGKIEYKRKEGRLAQRICVTFSGFELTDRSCWGKYISEIMNVADDFFDAVEAPMRDLIS